MSQLKPYPEYKDSGFVWLGHVPQHWVIRGLKYGTVTSSGTGFPHDYQGNQKEAYAFHKVNSLTSANAQGVIHTAQNTVSRETANKLRAEIFQAGSLVIAKIGAALLLNRIRILGQPACIDNNMMGIKVRDTAHQRFVFYLLQIVDFRLLANPGAVPSLNEKSFRSFQLPWPPLAEQLQIAKYLDHETAEIDASISEQENFIALLQERRSATIGQVVTKGLDPYAPRTRRGDGTLESIPKSWSVGPTKHLGIITLGKMLQPTPRSSLDVESRYLRAANVQPQGILKLHDEKSMWFSPTELKRLTLQKGDMVIVEGGVGGFGRVAYIDQDLDGWAFQNSIIRLRPHPFVDGRFVTYVYLHLRECGYISMVSSVSSMPHFTAEKVAGSVIAWPAYQEQGAIADYLDRETAQIDAAIEDAREAIRLSRERRAALISAVMTGKIDVRDWSGSKERVLESHGVA